MDWKRAVAAVLAAIKSRQFLAVVESLGALAGCVLISFLIGAVLTVLLVPTTFEAELTLEPRRADPAPLEDVAQQLERTGLIGGVETTQADDGPRLLLTGLPSAQLPHDVLVRTLSTAGYGIGDLSIRPAVDQRDVIERIGVAYLTLQALVFVLAGALLIRFRLARRSPAEPTPPLISAGLGVLAGLGAFATSFLVASVLRLVGVDVHEQQWVVELLGDREGLYRLVPWLVLIVPVSEEVFFRGYMFRWLLERAGARTGFTLSAAAFALLHFNPSGFLIYFGVGLILAWVCRRTGGLLAPIAAHVVYNTTVLTVALLSPPPL